MADFGKNMSPSVGVGRRNQPVGQMGEAMSA